MRALNAILLSVALAVSVRASVTITVDRLDPSDGGSQPPAGIVVVDVLVDVQAADRWTIGGFRGEALGGASLIYAIDPETGQPRPTNPGVDHRFVSFVSQPRPRDADARFNDSGATVGGSFCNGGSAPTLTPLEFNIDWMPTMPPPPGMDGAIVRVALDVSTVCQGQNAIVVVGAPPPTVVTLFRSVCLDPFSAGTVAATFDDPTLTGVTWGVYAPIGPSDCPGDIDCDRDVDLTDLAAFLQSFGSDVNSPYYRWQADIVHDGQINLMDLAALLAAFGETCP